MTGTWTTHVLGPGDVALLRALNALFAAEFDEAEEPACAQPPDNDLHVLLAGDVFLAIVALRDGRLVGGLSGYFLPRPTRVGPEFYLYDLAVAPFERRRGIATGLIARCTEVARDRGATGIFVQAHPEDDAAVALYEALGERTEVLHFDIALPPPRLDRQSVQPPRAWFVEPIATVRAARKRPDDDCWGGSTAEIVLEPTVPAESLRGLATFSLVEVVFVFDQVLAAPRASGVRRPRNNPAWPEVGIFAQRAKNRPNRVGTTMCGVLAVEDRVLRVAELDAIDGTPVIDIKPVITQFLPRGPTHQPDWADELMTRYWEVPIR